MARMPRAVFSGLPHHITQRGNRREDVFLSDADRSAYLSWLQEYCEDNGVRVLAYCLMTNHVHIVATPDADDGFEETFRPLHTRYAMRLNRKRGSPGHVWQGRYFSSVLDESYLWSAIRYVECNPVRAGMVEAAEEYRWSSAAAHCGLRDDAILTRCPEWAEQLRSVWDWAGWLADGERPDRVSDLRRHFARGLPCGSEGFVRSLEQRAGRCLGLLRPGRPRKDRDR